jgi:hypothetical protein
VLKAIWSLFRERAPLRVSIDYGTIIKRYLEQHSRRDWEACFRMAERIEMVKRLNTCVSQ